MPNLSKASAIAIGLSILASSTVTIFANDLPDAAKVKPGIKTAPIILNKGRVPERLTSTDIENKLSVMKEKLASREAVLKVKLQSFRDKKKATAAARISENLNKINQNQTAAMQKFLDLMWGILDKLENRINRSTPDIKDPTSARAAVVSARTAIASASAAIDAQAQKDYTLQVTSENKVKADAGTMRNNVHRDILALRKTIANTKQAVTDAIRTAKSEPKVTNYKLKIKEGTISGNQ